MSAGIAEAAQMIGRERNTDVVAPGCSPPLVAVDGMTQWNPNLIRFNYLSSDVSSSC